MTRARPTDEKRFDALKRKIADIRPIRRGSVVRRFMPCGKPGCRCQANPSPLHGPYYQWTRKVEGKTRTTRVDQAQAKLLRGWIDNGRRLDRIVKQLERVSMRLTDKVLRSTLRDCPMPHTPPANHAHAKPGGLAAAPWA